MTITYETMTAGISEIIDRLTGPCDYLGVSIGCEFGIRIAVKRPELIRSLVLSGGTAIEAPDDMKKALGDLANTLRKQGWDGRRTRRRMHTCWIFGTSGRWALWTMRTSRSL